MIEAYIGKQRTGKTYGMVRRIKEHLDSGNIVFVNFPMTYDPYARPWYRFFLHRLGILPLRLYPTTNLRQFLNWEDIMHYTNAIVALDEGWQYFDSYQKLSIDKRMRLYQSGKREIQFLYTVQRYMMADINLRWSTDVFHESKSWKVPFTHHKLIRYRSYDLQEDNEGAKLEKTVLEIDSDGKMTEKDMAIATRWIFTSNAVYKAYDTKADVYANEQTRKQLASKIDARSPDSSGFIYPEPSYWGVIKNYVKPKHVDRRPTQTKRRV